MIFSHIDKDGNGTIDIEEFMNFMDEASHLVGDNDMLESIFKMLDVNKDGRIPKAHLKNVVVNKAYALTEDEYKILFEEIDKDDDEVIEFEEFKELMKNGMLY